MRRRAMFARIAGVFGALRMARAQQSTRDVAWKDAQDHRWHFRFADGSEAVAPEWLTDGKPKNGQCPVCGTMAPPFKPTVEELRAKFGPCAPTEGLAVCRGWDKSDLPKSQEIRCVRCNVKYVQNKEIGIDADSFRTYS